MAQDHKITPKLSERFSDLFGVDDVSFEASSEVDSMPVYLEESRKFSLNKLLHLAPYSEVLLLLGEQGVGKTTLLQAFVERVATTWRVSYVSSTPAMDVNGFLRQIAKGFDLDLDVIGATEDLLWELNRYLQALGRSGRRAIIVIDEAHLLADEVILIAERILLNERTEDSVSLVLSMRLDQGNKLERFAVLNERLAYTLMLEPFSEKEVAGYVRQRFADKTAQSESLFTPEVIATLHQKSGGVAELINTLVLGMLAQTKHVAKPETKKKPLLLGVAVLFVGVVAATILYYQDEINQLFEVPAEQPLTESGAIGAAGLAATQEGVAEAESVVEEASVVHLQNDQGLPVPIPEIEQDLAEALPAADVQLGTLQEPSVTEPVVIDEPAGQAQQDQADPMVIVAEKTVPEPAAPESEPEPTPAEPELSSQLKWLMAQPGSNYTLQLMALVDENKVLGYVDKLNIADRSATYPITRRGRELIVLVYGSFASRAEAKNAADAIPKSIGIGEPWIRSFASVRKDMARR